MDSLPFRINFFKQIEIFQGIERLDQQFEEMLSEWKQGEYRKRGLSARLNINYPTWEIEKKILLWTARHHKHLGSPLATSHLSNPEFREDIHASETELAFAGEEEVLKNLVARGLASWEKGALISKEGLEWGLLISSLYVIKPERDIKRGNTRFREEKLIRKRYKFVAYKLLNYASIIFILLSLILLSISITEKVFNDSMPSLSLAIRSFLIFMLFLPAILFVSAFILIEIIR